MAWRNIDTDLALPADASIHGDDVADGYEPPVRRGAEPTPARAYGSGALAGTEGSREPKRDTGSRPTLLSEVSSIPERIARLAAQQVVILLREIDRKARHAGRTVPSGGERDAVGQDETSTEKRAATGATGGPAGSSIGARRGRFPECLHASPTSASADLSQATDTVARA
jgi:hypothetical protein